MSLLCPDKSRYAISLKHNSLCCSNDLILLAIGENVAFPARDFNEL